MIRLLIADDEPETRTAIRETIDWEANGIAVCGEASNGKDAILQLPLLQPDVLLLDIRMPIVDGLEVIQHIHDNSLPVKVILLSGHDEFQYAQRALRLGASDYLLKPCRPEDILASILRIASGTVFHGPAAEQEAHDQVDGLIGAVLEYIDSHCSEGLDLAKVAAHIYITPAYLSLLFKQKTGVNFIDHLNKVRVKKACRLMENLSLKVYEIARMSGYKDEKYFTRVFKKLTGQNPTQYRKDMLRASHRSDGRQ